MKYETPILETERLILKRGTYEDFVKVYEYDMTRLRNIAGEFEYVKYDPERLKGWENAADEDYTLDFILYLKDSNEPIGNLTFDRYDSTNNSLEISCNMHPNYWKKGYMGEAIIKAMKYIFDNLNIDNIRYRFAQENIGSQRLCEKIGFLYEGEKISHHKRLDKDIKVIKTIMSKEDFYKKYNNKRR